MQSGREKKKQTDGRERSRRREAACVRASYKVISSEIMEDNDGGKEVERQTTCIIDVPVSPASLHLFFFLLLFSYLLHPSSLLLRSSKYLHVSSLPLQPLKTPMRVSQSFRYIPPGIPAVASVTRYLSRVHAYACTLSKISPSR